jgi:hypothetical protein
LRSKSIGFICEPMIAKDFPDDDPELARVDAVLDQVRGILGEHFDVGLVLLTSMSSEGITSYHSTAFGNKFAIRGVVEAYSEGAFDDFGDFDDEE